MVGTSAFVERLGPARALLDRAAKCMRGPRKQDRIPGRERARQGKEIARLARSLKEALDEVVMQGVVLPHEFNEEFSKAASRTFEPYRLASEVGVVPPVARGERHSPDLHSGAWLTMFRVGEPSSALRYPALTAMEAGGEAWSKSKPILFRPNAPAARRLYFLRCMTAFFREEYGTPLREVTATLNDCLFEEQIDVSTVAKLAP